MGKFGKFLKDVFVSKFWIKAITFLLAFAVVILLNINV